MKKQLTGIYMSLVLVSALLMGCGSTEMPASAPVEELQVTSSTAEWGATSEKMLAEDGTVVANGKLIYVITPATSNSNFKIESDAAEAEAIRLGYKTKAVSHDGDVTKQKELIHAAITEGASAIILDHAEADVSIDAVKIAKGAGIPTFCINTEIGTQGVAAAQIIPNYYQGAKLVGDYFTEAMGENGEYAELTGKPSDTNTAARSEAFHEVIDRFEGMNMVAQETANWDQTEAYEKTQSILQAYPNVKGIVCGNDTMAVGAAAAIQAAVLEGKVIVAGVGNSGGVLEQVTAGTIICTCVQPIAECAKMAVQQADTYIRTGITEFEEKQLVDCTLITQETTDKLPE